jgi:hypothetical protein
MTLVGLPHSEIAGSKRACRSPTHIAACHVLHRLSVPRHPPSTLSNLTIKCLDLMRSAVRRLSHTRRGMQSLLCISFFTINPYSIVKEALVARTNAGGNRSIVSTACPAGLAFRSLRNLHNLKRGNRYFGSAVGTRVRAPLSLGWSSMNGGADRDRTDDPLLAKQMLSQLSYSPGVAAFGGMWNVKCSMLKSASFNIQHFAFNIHEVQWWA